MKQDATKFEEQKRQLVQKQLARAKARQRLKNAQKKENLKASNKYSGMASIVKKKKNKSLMIKIGGFN